MNHIVYILLISCLVINHSNAQETISIFRNSSTVKNDRYQNIEGSPYLFQEFIGLDIVSRDGQLHQNLFGNFNGHKGTIEVLHNGEIKTLADKWITIIKFYPNFNMNKGLIMIKGGHPKHEDQFTILLHRGEHLSFIKEFKIGLSEVRNRDVDKKILKKTFLPTEIYYILKGDKIHKVTLNKRSILKHVKSSEDLDAFILEQQIDFNIEDDIVKFFVYSEHLESPSY